MTKVIKIPSTEQNVLEQIRKICINNAEQPVSMEIVRAIDRAAIPMQMDNDLMRRLTDPACNPHDTNFQMPLAMLDKTYPLTHNL